MAEVVVITGGTAGVGRAVARRFARQGAKLAILARGKEELRAAAVEVVTLGATAALAIPVDLDDLSEVEAATQRIEAELGPIDVWVDAVTEPRRRSPWWAVAGVVAGAIVGVVGIWLRMRQR